jgi:hypothetical protein
MESRQSWKVTCAWKKIGLKRAFFLMKVMLSTNFDSQQTL